MILTFAKLYDSTLHYFMFQDFLLAPMLDEFAHIFHMPVRDQVLYMSYFLESTMIAQALHLKKEFVYYNLRAKGNIRGFPSKFCLEKATLFANSGSLDAFYAIFSLLIYGLVLLPKVEGLIDKTVITTLISKNLVPNLLANIFFSFHCRNRKKGGTINCCIPLLHKWILTHFPRKWSFADNIGASNWSQRLMSLSADDIVWYSRDYDGLKHIFSYGDFQNIPLISAKGGFINYNHVLSPCQLGYPLKENPGDKQLEEFLVAKGVEDSEMLKRICRAW